MYIGRRKNRGIKKTHFVHLVSGSIYYSIDGKVWKTCESNLSTEKTFSGTTMQLQLGTDSFCVACEKESFINKYTLPCTVERSELFSYLSEQITMISKCIVPLWTPWFDKYLFYSPEIPNCCWLCSPPVAEYALAVECQFWLPTFLGWLRASWEGWIVRGTTTRRLPFWANGLFYPSWNRLRRFTAYR